MRSTSMHPAQYEIFIDQVLNPASPHNNIGLVLQLNGLANVEELQIALSNSIKQFDAFKLRFDFNDTEPVAYLSEEPVSVKLLSVDFSLTANAENEAKQWMQQRFNQPFALQKDTALYEFAILCIQPLEHWFFCRFHHLLIDGYGLKIFIEHLSVNLKMLARGESNQSESNLLT